MNSLWELKIQDGCRFTDAQIEHLFSPSMGLSYMLYMVLGHGNLISGVILYIGDDLNDLTLQKSRMAAICWSLKTKKRVILAQIVI